MIKRLALILALSAALAGCGQEKYELSPEEKLLSQMFAMLNTAMAYDQACNASTFINERNANLYANTTMLAGRMFRAIQKNRPDKTPGEIEDQIKYEGGYAQARAREVLDNKGCGASESKTFEQALSMFTQTTPAQLESRINQELRKL